MAMPARPCQATQPGKTAGASERQMLQCGATERLLVGQGTSTKQRDAMRPDAEQQNASHVTRSVNMRRQENDDGVE